MNRFTKYSVTFWHGLCLMCIRTNKFLIMKNLTKQYEMAKRNANQFMQNGQIGAYFEALLEMNKYKRLMVAIVAN